MERTRERERPKKRWWDEVEEDIQRVVIVINDNIIGKVTDLYTWDTVYQNTKVI